MNWNAVPARSGSAGMAENASSRVQPFWCYHLEPEIQRKGIATCPYRGSGDREFLIRLRKFAPPGCTKTGEGAFPGVRDSLEVPYGRT